MIATPGTCHAVGRKFQVYKAAIKRHFKPLSGTNFASLILIVLLVCILKGILNVNARWLDGIKILGCLYIAYIRF